MHSTYPLAFAPHHAGPEQATPDSLLFAFKHRELLVTPGFDVLTMTDAAMHGVQPVRTQYLGQLGELHCFSGELDPSGPPPPGFLFRDLRRLFGKLDPELHAVAGRAVQIAEWDRTHQFCGICGRATELSSSDRSRRCPECRAPMYPRLAPAMIVAVEKGDQILLARSGHFPPEILSVLAGFVEPGESAEEAVIREVWEEARIVVEDVRYFGSQPWPFPNSLMLGFTAQYKSGEVDTSHDTEVEAAGWFAYDALPPTFPGRRSISQWLLQDFVARKIAERGS
jgi:NAD+ diphosphatase